LHSGRIQFKRQQPLAEGLVCGVQRTEDGIADGVLAQGIPDVFAGLISGLYGGKKTKRMLAGTSSPAAMCQPAWSMTMMTNSLSWRSETMVRNIDMVSVFTHGRTKLSMTPSCGLTAANA